MKFNPGEMWNRNKEARKVFLLFKELDTELMILVTCLVMSAFFAQNSYFPMTLISPCPQGVRHKRGK